MEHLHMYITLLTLAGAMILLVTNAIRSDLVAMLIILSLLLTGVLEAGEAFSGFSSTVVVIIASMFIVGKSITHTGIAQRVGDAIIRYGGSRESALLVMIMIASGIVGAFMSSTATVAIFIPIALTVADKANLNHKRLLMPLAVASLVSGMMTLVATTPNIVVNNALTERGLTPLAFFSFTPFGLLILALAIVFMVLIGREMLAAKGSEVKSSKGPSINDLLHYHNIDKNEFLLRVPVNSDLVDTTVANAAIGANHHLILLAVQRRAGRRNRVVIPARPETVFEPDDMLLVIGAEEHVEAFSNVYSLQRMRISDTRHKRFFQVVGIAEVMLNPDSSLIGKTLRDTLFQTLFHSMVLGVRRKGETITEDIADLPLKFGDVLLVCGAWTDILKLKEHKDQYLLLTLPQDYKEYIPGRSKEKLTLAIVGTMVVLMAFEILPAVSAIVAASAALVFFRCVPTTSIYDVIDWPTIIMIAGILPLALALQKTGVVGIVSGVLVDAFSGAGALWCLGGLFLVTASLGIIMSNSAVAVLVAPMAIDIGLRLDISPQACAMVVAIACSSAFLSPLGSPVNMLVREPGGYSFMDFFKVGLPLLIVSLAATLLLCRILYL